MDFRPRTRRLNGLSSRNPEAGWTIVQEPDGCVDLQGDLLVYFFDSKSPPSGRPSLIARLLVNFSQEIAGLSYGPGDSIAGSWDRTEPRISFRTRRHCWDPEVSWGSEGRFWSLEAALDPEDPEVVLNPVVSLDPEVVLNPGVSFGPEGRFEPGGRFELRDPEVISNPEVVLNPGLYKNLEVYLFQALRSFLDPETAWGLKGIVLRLPRQDYFRYLFRFRIMPLGSWPLSSSYAVFYFCRKSLTGLEGDELACFVRCSLRKRMDARVGAGASLNRNLEAGVLPEAWMISPNQFAPYFPISSSNSGNNLCTQVNRICYFSAGFPLTGHRSSNPSSLDLLRDDMARFRTLVEFHGMSRLIHGARGLKKIHDPGLAFRWMARLVCLAGEDHLYLLKSAVGDLLPRSGADIAPGGETSRFCLEPRVSIDFIQHRTLSSGDGPLSMSTGCGPMSRLRWLPFADPFRMSSGPYRAASLFQNCCGTRGPEDYGDPF
ncbi:hypothetical protein F2Q68_00015245 [Brassica cretica]|uniref:Uncharacterized protein n=1 Tax=Brassica cretica TaxID=69181 RepID=A0A8S9HG82_BRACR|nr:hypothetical protein F2Q68_00015245 [Brassica cretica]